MAIFSQFQNHVPDSIRERDVSIKPKSPQEEVKGEANPANLEQPALSNPSLTSGALYHRLGPQLPLVARKFRLLRLHAAKLHNAPIWIDTFVTNLTLKPPFEAVSYTWADRDGDTSRCDRVYVGKHWDVLPVTRNCANALRRLRFPNRWRDLWVDAICIDQDNEKERSHQVGLMQSIYATAVRVLVYLGEDPDGDDGMNPIPWTDGKYVQRTLASPSALAENSYFRRVWVIQEIAAARDAWVLYGSRGAHWNDFLGVRSSEADTNHNRDLALSDSQPAATDILPQWLYIWTKPGYMELDTLLNGLYATAQCKASDPRDKVFALLGLFHGANNAALVADYTLTHHEVVIGVTAYIFVHHTKQMWRIFAAIDPKDSQGMPSWVMDWSSETKTKRLGPYMHGTKSIDESEGKESQRICTPRIYRNGALVLRGHLVAQAASCAFNQAAREGPPGVVTDIVYRRSRICHQRSGSWPMVPSGWCQSTDEIFAVQSLSGYCLILRPITTSPKTYRFVAICERPKMEPMATAINLLDRRAILLFSTWRYILKEEFTSRDIWYSSEPWDMVRDLCHTVKEFWALEETISRFLDSLVKRQASVEARLLPHAALQFREASRKLKGSAPKSMYLQQKQVPDDSMKLASDEKSSGSRSFHVAEPQTFADKVCEIEKLHVAKTRIVDAYNLLGQSLAKKDYLQRKPTTRMYEKIHDVKFDLRQRDFLYWHTSGRSGAESLDWKTFDQLELTAKLARRGVPEYLDFSNLMSRICGHSEINPRLNYDTTYFIVNYIPMTHRSFLQAQWDWGANESSLETTQGAVELLSRQRYVAWHSRYIEEISKSFQAHCLGSTGYQEFSSARCHMPSPQGFATKLLCESLSEKVISLFFMYWSKDEDWDKQPRPPQYERMVQWLLDSLNLEPSSRREDPASHVHSVEDTWAANFLRAWSDLMGRHRSDSVDDAEPPERQEASEKGYLADAKAKWAPLLDLVRETEEHLYPLEESFLEANRPTEELNSEAVWEDIVIV
ncbi:hypothetical protein CSIM01_07236 [Colletotrichum simmondsii]|uniref:Heterokaryon incompatibility domain-containing protein n=1 Tax=Colletotrichum simmondsii TaxID=703756 RepID=A0A135RQD8_9PEZI|nr:hypothetical protein CSIM01_07236 [Colletotrichum simmondsii]